MKSVSPCMANSSTDLAQNAMRGCTEYNKPIMAEAALLERLSYKVGPWLASGNLDFGRILSVL